MPYSRIPNPVMVVLLLAMGWLTFPVGGLVAAEKAATLTTAKQVRELTNDQASQGLPVTLTGVISYSEPTWSAFGFQDDTGGTQLIFGQNAIQHPIGQQITITGVTIVHGFFPAVQVQSQTLLMPTQPMVNPKKIAMSEVNAHFFERISLRGTIRRAEVSSGFRLVLTIAEGANWIQVIVRTPVSSQLDTEALIDSTVSFTGYCQPMRTRTQETAGYIFIRQFADLKIEERSKSDPWQIPLTPIRELPRVSDHRLRIQGIVNRFNDSIQQYELRDDTGTVHFRVNKTPAIRIGDRLELLGYTEHQNESLCLRNCTFRMIAPKRSAIERPEDQLKSDDYLPILQTSKSILDLPLKQAERGYPVHVRATVTHIDVAQQYMTIADTRGGLQLTEVPKPGDFQTGQLVELRGFTQAGPREKRVLITKLSTSGEGIYPKPILVDWNALDAKQHLGQWVMISGVIREVEAGMTHRIYSIQTEEGVVQVVVPDVTGSPPADRGTPITCTGVSIPTHPVIRKNHIPVIAAPASQFIESSDRFVNEPFNTDITPIKELAAAPGVQHMPFGIHIRGKITYCTKSKAIIQDGTDAVNITGEIPPYVNVDEVYDVVAYRNTHDGRLYLDMPIFHRTKIELPLQPREITIDELLTRIPTATLVTTYGIVIDRQEFPDGRHLVTIQELDHMNGRQLQLPIIFPATSEGTPPPPEMRSIIRVTGMMVAQDDQDEGNDYLFHLQPGSTVEIIKGPSWWTAERVQFLVSSLFVLLLISAVVAILLSRQLVQRNSSLQQELEDRKRLETQLTDFVETANDVLFTLDSHGRILTFNQSGEKITGRSRNVLLRQPFEAILAARSPRVNIAELLTDARTFEVVIVAADGKPHDWEIRSRPGENEHHQRVIHAIARDITARKSTENELRRLYKMQMQQLENSPLAFVEWSPDFRVLRWSQMSEKIFGYTAEEVIGKRPSDFNLVYESDESEVFEVMAKLQKGLSTNTQSTNRNNTKDGRVIHVEWYCAVHTDEAGRVLSVLSLAQDITHRINEEANRQLLDEQMRQSQKMEAIGRLAGGVAHDFNNLLTVINGCSEMMLHEVNPSDPLAELANEIRIAGEQAASLTRQLLAFARREITNPTVLDVNNVVRDVEKMLRRMIGEHIELETRLESADAKVKMDPSHLVQLLMNLAVNARDAMPDGGKLIITTDIEDHWQVVEVRDTGIGMDDATKARIFEPFFTTKPVGQSTGIGLATVHSIVTAAQGQITVDSQLDQGTTFRIFLPLCHDRSPAKVTSYARRPELSARETVFIVEDEDLVRTLATRVLEAKGYRVFSAPCPADALDLFPQIPGHVDLLISDVVMPGMGGRKLAEKLTELQPDLRVLFMSGYTADEVLRQGISEEQVHFIHKPFTTEEFARKVRDVLLLPINECV